MSIRRGWWAVAFAGCLGAGFLGCESETIVEVVPVAEVEVSPSNVTLTVGGSQQLAVTLKGGGGHGLGGRSVTWSSSNTGVATVNNTTGLVTGVGPGTATITATSEGKSGSATATVPTFGLTVAREGAGTGTVTSSPAGITCGTSCSAEFGSGAVVTLTASASAGSVFAGWSGACTGTGSTCQVTMTQARSVTATFNPQIQILTVAKSGTGSGTVTSTPVGIDCGAACQASFAYGTVVTLTAAAAGESVFAGWSGACTGTGSTCQVTMSEARNVTATFNVRTYALSVAKAGTGSGRVTSSPAGIDCGTACGAEYASGTVVTLTATPAVGSVFAGWSGACTGAGSTCQVTMSAARSVTATFNTAPTLTLTKAGAGSGRVTSSPEGIDCGTSCSASFAPGTVVTLTATAAVGSAFTGWSGACSGTAGTCQVTMDAAKSVTATFALAPALTVTKAGTGGGTVTSSPAGNNCGSTCSASFVSGTVVTLTAAPSSGSMFAGWSGACTGTGSTCQVTMDQAKSVTATFNLSPLPTLTVEKTGSGTGTVTSSPAGIDCGSTCTAGFTSGTVVTLTASPAAGSVFTEWGGACVGPSPTCQVTVDAMKTVTATFTQIFPLTVTRTGSGSGTVTSSPAGVNCGTACAANFAVGTVVTLTAEPSAGSVFMEWSGACTGTSPTCQVTMDAARSVTAKFDLQLPAPTGVAATQGTTTAGITVSWSAVTGAASYRVLRAGTPDATFWLIAASSVVGTSWTDTSVSVSVNYYYRVQALNGVNVSPRSDAAVGYRAEFAAPTGVSATDGTGNGAGGNYVRVSWSAVAGAAGYTVYRATSATGTYTSIGNTTNLYLDNSPPSYNVTYYYRVRAYSNVSFPGVWSAYDSGWRWNMTANLTGHWPFDNNWLDYGFADSKWDDFTSFSGNPSFSTGIVRSYAARFDGDDMATSTGKTFMSSDRKQVSVAFWVAFMSNYTSINYFMMCSDFGFNQKNGNEIAFAISTPSTNNATTTIPLSTWTHIVGTYDGSTIRIYKNGTLAASTAWAGTVSDADRFLQVGGWTTGSWNGFVDDLRIYNRVLTASEIQGLFGWR